VSKAELLLAPSLFINAKLLTNTTIENAIVDAIDDQIPVTQLKRVGEGWGYACLWLAPPSAT